MAAPRPARGARGHRRPRHVRGGGAAAARHAERGQPADPGAGVDGRAGARAPDQPVPATPAGERLLRLARQTSLLYDEAARRAGRRRPRPGRAAGRGQRRLARTWFRDVLGSVAGVGRASRSGCTWRTRPTPPDLLRSGDVLGRRDVRPGRRAGLRGGAARHAAVPAGRDAGVRRAVAARSRHRLGRGCRSWSSTRRTRSSTTSWPPGRRARRRSCTGCRPRADFHEAVRLGLGWAAIPEPQLDPDLESGPAGAALGAHPRRRTPALAALAPRLPAPSHRRRHDIRRLRHGRAASPSGV